MATTIEARLDKTGNWLLCGRPNCGDRLAEIDLLEPEPRSYAAWLASNRDRSSIAEWTLGPGWELDGNGVWRITNRSRARRRQSEWIAEGNALIDPPLAEEHRRRLSEGRCRAFRKPSPQYRGESRDVYYHHGKRLGPDRLARCEPCTGLNRLDDRLARDLWSRRLSRVQEAVARGVWDWTEFVERLAADPAAWGSDRVRSLSASDERCLRDVLSYIVGEITWPPESRALEPHVDAALDESLTPDQILERMRRLGEEVGQADDEQRERNA